MMNYYNDIRSGLKHSFSLILGPKAAFSKILNDNGYGHVVFLIFYGFANNAIGYLHSPERFAEHAHSGLAAGSIAVGVAAFHAITEVLAYSIVIFLMLRLLRRNIGYHQVLKTLSYSLAPLLYIGAVWGLIAGERLRYWEAGTSPWTPWSIPYTAAHGFFIYLIVLGFFMMYRKAYPDFGQRFFEIVFGPNN